MRSSLAEGSTLPLWPWRPAEAKLSTEEEEKQRRLATLLFPLTLISRQPGEKGWIGRHTGLFVRLMFLVL
jgi:hypothetical protein